LLFGGCSEGIWRTEFPSVVLRGETSLWDLGDDIPQKLKQFADIIYRF